MLPTNCSTFSFAYIPFVTIWGFILFGEWPTPATIGGIVLIFVAGSLAVRR